MSLMPKKLSFPRTVQSIADNNKWIDAFIKEFDKWYTIFYYWALNIVTKTLTVGESPNQITIDKDGNITFTGGAGLIFGNMWNHDTSTTVTPSGVGVATRIPSGFTGGYTNGLTFQNAREFKVLTAGKYAALWNVSFTAGAANQEVEGTLMVDNAEVSSTEGGSAHRKISTGTDTGNMAAPTILDLTVDEVVSLGIINETSTNDVTVEHSNLVLVQVGG